jgi:hypothetical protein
MKTSLSRFGLAVLVLGCAVAWRAWADDDTIVHQEGNVIYVFPWKACLLVSAAASGVIYFLRGGR